MVADAIARELDRKGQVYYVSNRVRSIDDAVKRVAVKRQVKRASG